MGESPQAASPEGADPEGTDPEGTNPAGHSRTAAMRDDLRQRIARIGHVPGRAPVTTSISIGIAAIDQALPGGGLSVGALHEATSAGPDTEHAAAATLFIAGILARLDGPVLWVLQQPDLFAPGLAAAGLRADRIVFAEAGKAVLSVMEEGLRHPGLAAVVGELTGRLSLSASRRLQLAAEQSGILAVLVRRSRGFDDPLLRQPTAAATRWRIAALPSHPALSHAPDTPGLGPARWRLELTRCRGGEPGCWIVEAGDATGRLGLVSDVSDRSDQATQPRSTQVGAAARVGAAA